MDLDQQISRVRTEGEALACAAEAGGFAARVPGCPEWDVEALVRHIGDIHRWVAMIVRERIRERPRRDSLGPEDRGELLAWYRKGCVALVEALEAASPDDGFWFWGPAPNAVAFWARRMANETCVHRIDAEAARGRITPLPVAEALDALDEWLGLVPIRTRAPTGGGRTLHIEATDGEGAWRVALGDPIEVNGVGGPSDCLVQGPASDLYLWSMNRQSADGLRVAGEVALLQVWSDSVRF